jgi:Tol biopolymer transport system component
MKKRDFRYSVVFLFFAMLFLGCDTPSEGETLIVPTTTLTNPPENTPTATLLATATKQLQVTVTATLAPLPKPVENTKPDAKAKIAFNTNRDGNWEIYVMNQDGSEQTNLTNNPAYDGLFEWSPWGSKIVFVSERSGELDIFVMNANGSDLKNLTNNPAIDTSPVWSPDGSKIGFISDRSGHTEVYVMNADGSNQTRITFDPSTKAEPAWSPDGKYIAFTYNDFDNNYNFDIYKVNVQTLEMSRLTEDPEADYLPIFSPDGKYIYFTSQRNRGYAFYRMDTNGENQIPIVTGWVSNQLSWSPDGSHFVGGNHLMDFRQSIYIFSANGSSQTPITEEKLMKGGDISPAWSPDGEFVAFISNRDGAYNIYIIKPDGSGLIQLTKNNYSDESPSWQPFVVIHQE